MNDRTINIAGNFNQPVDITNSLQNGEGCVADAYSHAEGYATSATGKYSYAGGYRANATHERSFVWSGNNDDNGNFKSNGIGTYNIYVNANNPLDKIYLNETTLKAQIDSTFGGVFSNASLKSSVNDWDKKNTFYNDVELVDVARIIGKSGTQMLFERGSTVTFGGNATAVTVTDGNADDRIATLAYVNNLFQSSLSTISTNYVKRGNSTEAIGSSIRPVYIDGEGNAVPISNNVVTRGDRDSEGSDEQFVYMNGGSITPSTGNVGDGSNIIYLENGTLTASTSNVGTTKEGRMLTYLKNGKITESVASVGSNLVPIYLSNGVLTQLPNNITIGGENTPIYIKNGSLTACSKSIPDGSGGGNGVQSVFLKNDTGDYDGKPYGNIGTNENNFIKQLKCYKNANNDVTIYGETTRPTISNIDGLADNLNTTSTIISRIGASCSGFNSSCSSLAASLEKYAPKFGIKVSGTGNVISSVAFENNSSSINLQKNITALTEVGFNGNGNVLTNLSISGSKLVATQNYVPLNITTDPTTSGNLVSNLTYKDGTITVSKTKAAGLTVLQIDAEEGTIGPNTTKVFNATVDNSYIPLGIVGIHITHAKSAAKHLPVIQEFHMDGNKAKVVIVNRAAATTYTTIDVQPTFFVLVQNKT